MVVGGLAVGVSIILNNRFWLLEGSEDREPHTKQLEGDLVGFDLAIC